MAESLRNSLKLIVRSDVEQRVRGENFCRSGVVLDSPGKFPGSGGTTGAGAFGEREGRRIKAAL